VEENKNKKLLFIIIPLILLAIAGTLFLLQERLDKMMQKQRIGS